LRLPAIPIEQDGLSTVEAVIEPAGTRRSADAETLDRVTRGIVTDLHTPRGVIFWTDMLGSAAVGWGAFGLALWMWNSWSVLIASMAVSGLALYRGLCFTHEITHLRRRAVPGFETAWNLLFGVPLLLPSFTYVGVHQSHHNLATYGTSADPEYLPFAGSRKLIWVFAFQSSLMIPLVLIVRFLILAPIGLAWAPFHRWLETHASSFAMNPAYRRQVPPAMARGMRRWETAILVAWSGAIALMAMGPAPLRLLVLWYGVLAWVSFLNTVRVLGAHAYESDGAPLDRQGQVRDSIDTPGGLWSELWAPIGLRYHALHHYYPGIPYHNLGTAYRRILAALPHDSVYRVSTSPSLPHSLRTLYLKARQAGAALVGR
jgi:fatty acid desaturase